ncbi:hypothetical protein K474DRAFT_1703605 [Panus rudis PR-1116 ss-1]|nr:hypothetical protein K474DRAFT_1703605 [Panus rudis PR-1116 ss-1]
MTDGTRLTTPPVSPPHSPRPDDPTTPDQNLRNRRGNGSTPFPGQLSPSASTLSSTSRIFDANQQIAFRANPLQTSTFLHNLNAVDIGTSTRKITIRSDPAMITCFDPADKELYDLWAPRQ